MWKKVFQSITDSRLRNRFTLFFIVLAAVPVLILGGITLYLIDLSHRYDVSSLELQLLDQKIEEIEKFFTDTLGVLQLQVSTDQSYIEASDQLFILQGLLAENRAFEEVSFVNLNGLETEKIARFQKETMEPFYVSSLDKFREAASGKNFVGSVYDTLSGPFLSLASPVRNRNGDIIQVLSAEIDIREIVQSIEFSRLGASGYVALIDTNGSLIASGNRVGVARGSDMSRYERVARALAGEIFDALGEQDIYESPFGGVPVIGAAKRIPSLNWALMAEWPLQDANAILNNVRNQVLVFTLFSIVAVILLAPLFANRLIRPIQKLKAGTLDIEKGNFEKRLEIKTGDELEELGSAFNNMAEGLKKLQELREEFVFIAAHELRAPVTVIKGYISMVLEGDTGPIRQKMKSFLVQVQHANERLLQLVEDLLEVARSEAGKIVIEVGPVDIRKPILATVQEVEQLAKEKSIGVNYQAPEAPHVLGNEGRIKEIMVNLVGNAIKYTASHGHVWIFHEMREKELVTNVKDDGYGIPQEAQSKIFGKFYRVESPETRDVTGTGLGLFIVKQLVEKMHGKIWFESEKAKGTTFSFSLPIAS